jgi:hypothetical protein
MRSTGWIGSGAAFGLSLLGISLGAALAGLVTLSSAGDALADGSAKQMGYRSGKAAVGYRNPARPGPALKGSGYRQAPLTKAHGYGPAPRVKRAPRAKRYYRSAAPGTCGQFKYWSRAKGRCLDARTSPPALK